MADYRNIHTRIWADSWFSELASDEKLTFIYLFSNPNASVSGLYEIPKRTIALDTGIEMSRLNEILDVFANAGKVFYQDGVVWVVNLRKYNDSGDSIKIRSCIQKDLEKIKDCELKTRYMDDLQIPYPEPQIPYPEKKSETKRNETKRNETRRNPRLILVLMKFKKSSKLLQDFQQIQDLSKPFLNWIKWGQSGKIYKLVMTGSVKIKRP